ncbi:MAG: class I SAM-dependent methyltransferase [Candidatus Thiodiazotropha sp. (ex Myrtea spinifera)]|nr:class I SAM-dependent methyltransferase [Candidatus Thiodiazotropha sp. (ex Myrtea spinifera)]MCU7830380.1 class I SAM-dependent methyltransferase [Candidatus Thiodiazotropha sp. (ex Myrtea sp. 'scaly one' KF741663)]
MSDRKRHWENIYQDKASTNVSWYQKEPILSLGLIRATRVTYDEPVIDVGGGASLLVDFLCKEGFSNLSVLDISAKALASTRERLGELSSQVVWHETDITNFVAPQIYSVWHDRAVFHFLTESADRKKYIEVLNRSLKHGGHLIIAAFAVGGPEKCSGLDIVQYDVDKISRELGEGLQLQEVRDEIHMTPADKEQKFIYFRFTRQSQ